MIRLADRSRPHLYHVGPPDEIEDHPTRIPPRTGYVGGESLAAELPASLQYVADVRRAALLAKTDLVTEMVGEFPELQGVMGRYYAAAQGEKPAIAAAMEEHYKPQGPSDRVPKNPVSVAVALADKLDTLVGFWAIDEKPTEQGCLCLAPRCAGRDQDRI